MGVLHYVSECDWEVILVSGSCNLSSHSDFRFLHWRPKSFLQPWWRLLGANKASQQIEYTPGIISVGCMTDGIRFSVRLSEMKKWVNYEKLRDCQRSHLMLTKIHTETPLTSVFEKGVGLDTYLHLCHWLASLHCHYRASVYQKFHQLKTSCSKDGCHIGRKLCSLETMLYCVIRALYLFPPL